MPSPLTPPPRSIPWTVKWGLIFGMGQTQPACMFFLVSFVLIWFLALRPMQIEFQFSRPTAVVNGSLNYVGPVHENASVSAFQYRRSLPVYACHVNFNYQGRTLQAISYVSSSQPPLQGVKTIPVEFVPGKPEKARINLPGFRATQLDPRAFFSVWFGWPVLLMPLLGLGLWLAGILRGFSLLRLLKQGRMVQARLVRQEDTGIRAVVNQERVPVYRLIFAYDVAGRVYELPIKTHEVQAITDEPREDLLYLPSNPNRAVLEDTLPDWMVRNQGTYHSSKPLQNYFELLLPSAVGAFLLYILFWA